MLDAHYFNAHIVTPERTMYNDAVVSVSVPTEAGVITIRSQHQPLFSIIRTGELVIRDIDNVEHRFAIDNGIIHHSADNRLTILADRSEPVASIDLARAEAAYDRARQLHQEITDRQDVAYARFEAVIEKELNRVRLAQRYRGGRDG